MKRWRKKIFNKKLIIVILALTVLALIPQLKNSQYLKSDAAYNSDEGGGGTSNRNSYIYGNCSTILNNSPMSGVCVDTHSLLFFSRLVSEFKEEYKLRDEDIKLDDKRIVNFARNHLFSTKGCSRKQQIIWKKMSKKKVYLKCFVPKSTINAPRCNTNVDCTKKGYPPNSCSVDHLCVSPLSNFNECRTKKECMDNGYPNSTLCINHECVIR